MPDPKAGPAAAEPAGEEPSLDPRRRRARFRAWHRGTREMDLVMGRYADREIARMSEAELASFEELLDLAEADVYAWVSGTAEPPANIDPDLIRRLAVFPGLQGS